MVCGELFEDMTSMKNVVCLSPRCSKLLHNEDMCFVGAGPKTKTLMMMMMMMCGFGKSLKWGSCCAVVGSLSLCIKKKNTSLLQAFLELGSGVSMVCCSLWTKGTLDDIMGWLGQGSCGF